MPKDILSQNLTLSQNLLSLIKKDKEIKRLQDELTQERSRNHILRGDYVDIKALTLSLQDLLDSKDQKISSLQLNISMLLEEKSSLKSANQALALYITQPFWKRWRQRLQFFLQRKKA